MAQLPLHAQPIPFITLPNWVKAATQCGFNIEPIFRDLGIETDLIHLESATIALPVLEKAMDACIQHAQTGHFPFVLGETYDFDYLPDLQTFVTTSPTLREATRVFDWVRELINPMIRVRLVEDGAVGALVLQMDDFNAQSRYYKPYFTETLFASVVKFGRQLIRGQADFTRLSFRHPAPEYAAAYTRHFGLPVAFSQPQNALEFDPALLDRRLSGGYPALHQQAEMRVEQRLAHLPRPTGLVAAVEEVLMQDPRLLGQGIGTIASQLGMHARTLQRRLLDHGQRFAELQTRVRYRLAVRYLEEPGADVESVSEKLGFSDRRSFTRAFTRWSGVSPSAFRNRAQH